MQILNARNGLVNYANGGTCDDSLKLGKSGAKYVLSKTVLYEHFFLMSVPLVAGIRFSSRLRRPDLLPKRELRDK